MNKYLKLDPWCVIEEGFKPENHKSSESLFSLGNGRMGQRASFEERYSGEMVLGNFIGNVYYPDPTRVAYWKQGYPTYFAKLVNVTSWIGIDIALDGEFLDLAKCKVSDFVRTLNMQKGFLERSFVAEFKNGKKIRVQAQRFLSMVVTEIGAMRYAVTPLNFSGAITITAFLDADVKNVWSNFGDKFVATRSVTGSADEAFITVATLKTDYHVATGMKFALTKNGVALPFDAQVTIKEHYVGNSVNVACQQGEELVVYKYAAVIPSIRFAKEKLLTVCKENLVAAYAKGFDALLAEHALVWQERWQHGDVIIEGDVAAQQAIRFCIYQLIQTYTGKDADLNIGPKGYTGEKYGGVTYWDTEAFCFPFYLAAVGADVAKNLLLYRYQQLPKAIANARNLGINNGGALYPMVTINGEECHNEWEITFEEIHRNGAMAYAIYNYVRYTGDENYLVDYGLETLIALARFWQARLSFSEPKNKYVLLGATGPNEYENNVDNNWYTLKMAAWTFQYTLEALAKVKRLAPEKQATLLKKINFDEKTETQKWQHIFANLYLPEDKKLGIFLQQDGYLDKEQRLASELDPAERPLNQHWSWDRVLRSCFIKQADVLQGIYFLEEQFDLATIRRNFDFYEPRTVHESSLSPCVHVILASKIGYTEKAYELYLRTARLDLDDYNSEIKEGCHITSMSGSWLAIVQGFGGMRVHDGVLHFNPILVPNWKSYAFKIIFRKNLLEIKVAPDGVTISNHSTSPITLQVHGKSYAVKGNARVVAALNSTPTAPPSPATARQ